MSEDPDVFAHLIKLHRRYGGGFRIVSRCDLCGVKFRRTPAVPADVYCDPCGRSRMTQLTGQTLPPE